MDAVTQMLFGATVAQAGFRRRLGRGAIAAGALVALVPDLDLVAGWIGGTYANWLHHRGITHSILFGLVVGPIFGWLIWRFHRWKTGNRCDVASHDTLRTWIYLSILALMTHPVIDLFTSYGTQLLVPLSRFRFAINALPIIDPVYSLAMVLALLVGIVARSRPRLAQDVAAAALVFIAAYTLFGWAINGRVEAVARTQLDEPALVTAYPTMFQPYYRRVVAETSDSVLIGYYSVLNPQPIEWRRYQRLDDPRLAQVKQTPEAQLFKWFSMENLYWQVFPDDTGGATVQATDIRYGLPGDTELGFWGIAARVDQDGNLITPVEPIRIERNVSSDQLSQFWVDIVGH